MLTQLVYIIYILCSSLAANNFYNHLFTKRNHIKHPVIACCILWSIAIVPCFIITGGDASVILSILANSIVILPTLLFYQGAILHKLCASFIACIVINLSEIGASIFFLTLNIFFPEENMVIRDFLTDKHDGMLLFANLLIISIMLFIFYKLQQLLKNCFIYIKPSLVFRLGIPLIIMVIFQNIIFAFPLIRPFLIFSIFYWITVCLCILMLNTGLKELKKQEEYNIMIDMQKAIITQQLNYFQKTTQEYQKIRKQNHDISNHLLSLSYLIEQGNTKEAKQYINELLKSSESARRTK